LKIGEDDLSALTPLFSSFLKSEKHPENILQYQRDPSVGPYWANQDQLLGISVRGSWDGRRA
jgi:hypothetical protein